VGQTRQYLHKRVYQHKNSCHITKINKPEKTALAKHHFDKENHHFDFINVEILDKECNWYKRNISEMIQIQMNDKNINYKTDVRNLNPIYKSILSNYKTKRTHHNQN